MREGRIQGAIDGTAATEESVMHLATHEVIRRMKKLLGVRELSTVVILVLEVLFFTW